MKANAHTATDRIETTRDTALRWVQDVSSLVSPPDICIRVFELVESNTATAQKLGEIIGCDPSLTARLLRLVNSSFYQFSRRIDLGEPVDARGMRTQKSEGEIVITVPKLG